MSHISALFGPATMTAFTLFARLPTNVFVVHLLLTKVVHSPLTTFCVVVVGVQS